jgi:hypothetical protein
MPVLRLKHCLTCGLITIIFLGSFRAFALYLTPIFNSDQAIHVLMAEDLRLPDDLYYWGQTRLGSLLPILAHAVMRVLPIEPIVAISWLQYLCLFFTFLGFASFLKHRLAQIILAFTCFLPVSLFLDVVQAAYPCAPQFALISGACVITEELRQHRQQNMWRSASSVVISSGLLMLSLWVSEQSIVLVLLMGRLIWQSCRYYDTEKTPSGQAIHQPLFGLTILLGLALIICGKVFATSSYGIFGINDLSKTLNALTTISSSIFNAATFRINQPLLSWYTILSGCIMLGTIVLTFRSDRTSAAQLNPGLDYSFPWAKIFCVNAVMSLGLLLNSEWVYINNLNPRYFSGIYFSTWLATLLWLDRLPTKHNHQLKQVQTLTLSLLLCTALIGSFSLPAHVFSRSQPPAQFQRLYPFRQLAPAGIIGDYWTAYEICAVDPKNLHCTAHDRDFVRSRRSIPKVMTAPTIYLVKEGWLNTFPAEITQFGQRLQQQGEAFHIDRYTLAPYATVR